MGDLIAASAVANGWAGVVINGAIRDRTAIAELPLGVKALGSNPRKSAKAGAGERHCASAARSGPFRCLQRTTALVKSTLAAARRPCRPGLPWRRTLRTALMGDRIAASAVANS